MTDKEKALLEDWEKEIKREICDINDETLYPDVMRGRSDACKNALEFKDKYFIRHGNYGMSVCAGLWRSDMENLAGEIEKQYAERGQIPSDYWYGAMLGIVDSVRLFDRIVWEKRNK